MPNGNVERLIVSNDNFIPINNMPPAYMKECRLN